MFTCIKPKPNFFPKLIICGKSSLIVGSPPDSWILHLPENFRTVSYKSFNFSIEGSSSLLTQESAKQKLQFKLHL